MVLVHLRLNPTLNDTISYDFPVTLGSSVGVNEANVSIVALLDQMKYLLE